MHIHIYATGIYIYIYKGKYFRIIIYAHLLLKYVLFAEVSVPLCPLLNRDKHNLYEYVFALDANQRVSDSVLTGPGVSRAEKQHRKSRESRRPYQSG